MRITHLVEKALSHYRQHCVANTERFLHTVKDWYRSAPVVIIIIVVVVVVIIIVIHECLYIASDIWKHLSVVEMSLSLRARRHHVETIMSVSAGRS